MCMLSSMPQGSDVGGLWLRFEKRWRFRWETQTTHGSSEKRVVVFTWGNERTASQRWNLNSVIFIQLFDRWGEKILLGICYVASSVSGTGATVVKRLDGALPHWSWVCLGRISGVKWGPLQTRQVKLRNVQFNAGHCGDIQRTTSLTKHRFSFNRLMSLPTHTLIGR